MAEAREIGGYVSTAAGLGLECSGFAPSWVFLQIILFIISVTLAIFDTYTDWEVVLTFREVGFNNPLLQRNDDWLRAWFLFALIGTVLTVILVVHDGIDVFYSIFKSCQKRCRRYKPTNAPNLPHEQSATHDLNQQNSIILSAGSGKESSTEKEAEISDPLKCCFRHGWNSTTRNETLSAITLWFQDVPMLTMAVLYGFTQNSCKTPDPRDATSALLDVGISATAAVIASSWRITRSLVRLYFTVKIAGKLEWRCVKCLKKYPEPKPVKPPGKCLKKFLPEPSESAYPPGTCAHHCLTVFFWGALMQMAATFFAVTVLLTVWGNYGALKSGKNFDDSLGIYRFSLTRPDSLLFNISGTIIPPNGSFVNFEQIPYSEQTFSQPFDIYCLSEFEYREKDFDIFFNVIEVAVVSFDGNFCNIDSEENSDNNCYLFYTFRNFVLYYASRDPFTGDLEKFDQTCSAIGDILYYEGGPKTDPSIDVGRLISRDGFPQNNEPLVVYHSMIKAYLLFSTIIDADPVGYDVSFPPFPLHNATLNCTVKYYYSFFRGAVLYNYRGAVIDQQGCTCTFNADLVCNALHHRNVSYGYLTEDSRVVPYTHCSSFPSDKIVPAFDVFLFVPCPCVVI